MPARNASRVNISRQYAETVGALQGNAANPPIPPAEDMYQRSNKKQNYEMFVIN